MFDDILAVIIEDKNEKTPAGIIKGYTVTNNKGETKSFEKFFKNEDEAELFEIEGIATGWVDVDSYPEHITEKDLMKED